MRDCDLEGHCECCWVDGLACCSCGEESDDYFDDDYIDDDYDYDDDLDDIVWDDDGTSEETD